MHFLESLFITHSSCGCTSARINLLRHASRIQSSVVTGAVSARDLTRLLARHLPVYVLWKSCANTVALRSFTCSATDSQGATLVGLCLRVAEENETFADACHFPARVALQRARSFAGTASVAVSERGSQSHTKNIPVCYAWHNHDNFYVMFRAPHRPSLIVIAFEYVPDGLPLLGLLSIVWF